MTVQNASASYEEWLGSYLHLIKPAVERKHEIMRQDPFLFLRATFYRWLQLWAETCEETTAHVVPSVGDLHVDNFGTWRDREGRLVWGINDVDEACALPYTQDLTRLATSAVLARRVGHLSVSLADICDAIMTGYKRGLSAGGNPIVLAEHRAWLRDLAIEEMDNPKQFWRAIEVLEGSAAGAPRELLAKSLPVSASFRIAPRMSGVGSLGRPRFVALATCHGGFVAREAKSRAPSAVAWLGHPGWSAYDGGRLLRGAVRAVDPFFASTRDWVVRRLAPDCTSVNLKDMPKRRDERRLLQSMGWETANLHASSARPILRDLTLRPSDWLCEAATKMSRRVLTDWDDWCSVR
jgi:Uncharacterized protein conserved in bacteria (DUF2252)